MTSEMDLRYYIYSNIGTVISGNFEDASMRNAGLVPTSGRLTLAGLFEVRRGDPVNLAYYRDGRIARLGKRMYAMSVQLDPANNTTEVTMGCALEFNKEYAPIEDVSLYANQDTSIPSNKFASSFKQISSAFVVKYCLNAVGITYNTIPVKSVFTLSPFVIDKPYLQVVSDLLALEGFVGYMNANGVFEVVDTSIKSGFGPVLDATNIVDMGPILDPSEAYPEYDAIYTEQSYVRIKLPAELTA